MDNKIMEKKVSFKNVKKERLDKSTRQSIALTLYAISAGFIGSLAANYFSTSFPSVKENFPIIFNLIGGLFVVMFVILMIILYRLTKVTKKRKIEESEERFTNQKEAVKIEKKQKRSLENIQRTIDNLKTIRNTYYLLILTVILGIFMGSFSSILSDFFTRLSNSGFIYAYPIYVLFVGAGFLIVVVLITRKFKKIDRLLGEHLKIKEAFKEFYEIKETAKKNGTKKSK